MRVDDRSLLLQREACAIRHRPQRLGPGDRLQTQGERAANVRRHNKVLVVHFGQRLQHMSHRRVIDHQRNCLFISGGARRQRQQQ